MGPLEKTRPTTDEERRNRLACTVDWCCGAATRAADAWASWANGETGDAVDALNSALLRARWAASALEEALADMEELDAEAGR